MGIYLPTGVTLDTHIGFRMTGFTSLQTSARLCRMVGIPLENLGIARTLMGFYPHHPTIGLTVTILTEAGLMTAVTVLGIIHRFYGMDGDKIGTMGGRHILTRAGSALLHIGFHTATFMAIDTV